MNTPPSNPLTQSTASADDTQFDGNLRPRYLRDYLGQKSVHEQMEIFIAAACKRKEALDHVLISGPPGLGKTTLAHIIANEMAVNLRQTSGPVLERAGDLVALLTNLKPHDVLFIDEIHRLSSVVEEVLYPAMEDYQVDIIIGEGPAARAIKLDVPPFTLIGATTRAGMLTAPLRDRFGIIQRMEFYTTQELVEILQRSSRILQLQTKNEGLHEIASRSRATPRIANRLLRRVRDYAEVKERQCIDRETAEAALDMLAIDPAGFDVMDRKLLLILMEKFSGGPVGLDNLSTALNEESDTIEEVLEPFLIQQGFITRTPRGRMVTANAWEHFGITAPQQATENMILFNQSENNSPEDNQTKKSAAEKKGRSSDVPPT